MRRITGKRNRLPMWVPSQLLTQEKPEACWRCIDTPCVSGPPRVSQVSLSIGSTVEVRDLCPVGAIEIGPAGQPVVDDSTCLNCGLCQTGCGLGSISYNPNSDSMIVATANSGKELAEAEAIKLRDAKVIEINAQWVVDPILVKKQLESFWSKFLILIGKESSASLAAVPAMIHNSLASLGVHVSLQARGANSLLSEMVFEEDGHVYLVEVETGIDTLDPVRRLMSGAATAISRDGVARDKLSLVLILPALPNKRVELFRICEEIKNHLGIEVLVIPLIALQAAVVLRRRGFREHFAKFQVSESSTSLSEAFVANFGFQPKSNWGMAASK